MEKMMEHGVPLRKAIAMGMHEKAYKGGDGYDMKPKKGKPKPKPAKKSGRKPMKGGY